MVSTLMRRIVRWDRPRLGAEGSLSAPGPPPTCRSRQLHQSVLTLFPDVEWMPIHTRACVGTLTGYVYSVGQFLLAGVAYAVPHWRHLQLLVSVPFFAFFIYSWCVGPGGVGVPPKPRGLQGTSYPPDLAEHPPHIIREGQSQKVKPRPMPGSDRWGNRLWRKDLPQGVQFSGFPSFLQVSSLPVLLPLPST